MDADEVDNHILQSVGVHEIKTSPNEKADADGAEHVDARTSTTYGHHAVESGEYVAAAEKCENAEQMCTFEPLLAHGNENKLLRNESHTEHGREGDEGHKTQHLAERLTIARRVVRELSEYWLYYAHVHSVESVNAHIVPLACITILPHDVSVVETSQEYGKDMGVELPEKVSE